ncbi:hypothetical protein [Nocardia sp. NPDC051570]|uniref:hypothetical protein n=1 Tax=Nocardia sp. NPDC051570 TaxID=3364324 RepID=UPI0037B1C2C9
MYWHPNVSKGHANQVGGAIRDKWRDLGWENSTLKYPTTRELAARKPGRFNHFEGGSIYWSSNTGAHSSWGRIRDKWADKDWESGPLGFPATDEFKAKNNGAGQHFESGSVYWSGNTDAHSSWGRIRDKWADKDWENGPLGYPATDEFKGNNNGAGQRFEGGSVYWSGNTDAHSSWGLIRDKWAELKWENGPLGYPASDEFKGNNNGAGQHFEGGSVYWSGNTGAHSVWGAIRDAWSNQNWENGRFGYPTSDEYDYNGGKAQNFQGGRIDWLPGDPANPSNGDRGVKNRGRVGPPPRISDPDPNGDKPSWDPSDVTREAPSDSPDSAGGDSVQPSLPPTSSSKPSSGPSSSATPSMRPSAPAPVPSVVPTPRATASQTPPRTTPNGGAAAPAGYTPTHRQGSEYDMAENCGLDVHNPHASYTTPDQIHTRIEAYCNNAPEKPKIDVVMYTYRSRWWGWQELAGKHYGKTKPFNRVTLVVSCHRNTFYKYRTEAIFEADLNGKKYSTDSANENLKEIECYDKRWG